jgi:uncharacterized protein (TIGR03067 family)
LTRRGVTLSAAALAVALAGDAAAPAVPPELATAALKAAVARASQATATATTRGVAEGIKSASPAPLFMPGKLAVAALLAVAVAGGVAGFAMRDAARATRPAGVPVVDAGPGVAADRDAEPGRPPRDVRLRGTWLCTEARFNDRPLDPGTLRGLRLVVSADRYAVRTAEGESLEMPAAAEAFRIEGPYRADPTATPATLDVDAGRLGGAEKTARGIYQLEDGTLRVCYIFGRQRPAGFRSPKGANVVLSVWNRQQP